jgi:hypothetical protein
MRKLVPPRLVGPYLTGQRDVLAGFVYRAADLPAGDPEQLHDDLGLGYPGSDFPPEMPEYYLICWPARPLDGYQDRADGEYYIDPIPIPVGAAMRRIRYDEDELVAEYDGIAWLQELQELQEGV